MCKCLMIEKDPKLTDVKLRKSGNVRKMTESDVIGKAEITVT